MCLFARDQAQEIGQTPVYTFFGLEERPLERFSDSEGGQQPFEPFVEGGALFIPSCQFVELYPFSENAAAIILIDNIFGHSPFVYDWLPDPDSDKDEPCTIPAKRGCWLFLEYPFPHLYELEKDLVFKSLVYGNGVEEYFWKSLIPKTFLELQNKTPAGKIKRNGLLFALPTGKTLKSIEDANRLVSGENLKFVRCKDEALIINGSPTPYKIDGFISSQMTLGGDSNLCLFQGVIDPGTPDSIELKKPHMLLLPDRGIIWKGAASILSFVAGNLKEKDFSPGARTVLTNTVVETINLPGSLITSGHLLLSLLDTDGTQFGRFLKERQQSYRQSKEQLFSDPDGSKKTEAESADDHLRASEELKAIVGSAQKNAAERSQKIHSAHLALALLEAASAERESDMYACLNQLFPDNLIDLREHLRSEIEVIEQR